MPSEDDDFDGLRSDFDDSLGFTLEKSLANDEEDSMQLGASGAFKVFKVFFLFEAFAFLTRKEPSIFFKQYFFELK